MNKFAIIGDSTCDLSRELLNAHDIDYCRMMVSWTDANKKEHEIFASLDWDQGVTHAEYFDILAGGIRIFTSQVSEQEFKKVFEAHLDKGEDIIYISCSSALSASIKLAENLLPKFQAKYPERKIFLVDSLNSCCGQGSMLIKASELRKEGKKVEEVADWIKTHRNEFHQLATVENLDTLKRAGRVKASSAFFGNLFGVKPILYSDVHGNNVAKEKAKGRRNALLRIVELTKQEVVNPKDQICYITNAEAKAEDVELLVSNLKKEIPFKDVIVMPMGPIIGASTGKGTLGVYFVGAEITEGE